MTIYKCWECNEEEILEPQYCCNGVECGCYGFPIDPPYCDECLEKLMMRATKRRKIESIFNKETGDITYHQANYYRGY
ncbi:hypothetical protein D3C81_793560 [compost metagenome]